MLNWVSTCCIVGGQVFWLDVHTMILGTHEVLWAPTRFYGHPDICVDCHVFGLGTHLLRMDTQGLRLGTHSYALDVHVLLLGVHTYR